MAQPIKIDPAIYDWWASRNPYPLEPGEPDPDEWLGAHVLVPRMTRGHALATVRAVRGGRALVQLHGSDTEMWTDTDRLQPYGQQITLFDCDHCGETVTRVPVRDAEEVWWVGPVKARMYCSRACLDAYAERHGRCD